MKRKLTFGDIVSVSKAKATQEKGEKK